jgi:hypothetical protein
MRANTTFRGRGEVYRADVLKLGQPVALKFLSPTLANDPVQTELTALCRAPPSIERQIPALIAPQVRPPAFTSDMPPKNKIDL